MGLAHALYALPSSWHRKLTPDSASENLKVALVWLVGFAGLEVMVAVGGAVVSTLQVKLAPALVLPAASRALTENVWLPWLKPE